MKFGLGAYCEINNAPTSIVIALLLLGKQAVGLPEKIQVNRSIRSCSSILRFSPLAQSYPA